MCPINKRLLGPFNKITKTRKPKSKKNVQLAWRPWCLQNTIARSCKHLWATKEACTNIWGQAYAWTRFPCEYSKPNTYFRGVTTRYQLTTVFVWRPLPTGQSFNDARKMAIPLSTQTALSQWKTKNVERGTKWAVTLIKKPANTLLLSGNRLSTPCVENENCAVSGQRFDSLRTRYLLQKGNAR